MSEHAKHWLDRIRALPSAGPVRIMNVCGGHERSIAMAGLRSLLPAHIRLIPGPGCPVCICPEEDIYQVIQWALHQPVTVVSFGDMLRVPVNVPRGEVRTLDAAKAAGADVRAVASPLDAARIALENPGREVVFHAVGFETTLAPTAAMMAQGLPDNLSMLASGRLTWPAVALLLESEDAGLDALIAPGHVSTVMGPEEWDFVATRHGKPVAVAGFTPESLLAAIYAVLVQTLEGQAERVSCYDAVVRPGGNPTARQFLTEAFDVVDATWRGIGTIANSGFGLTARHSALNAMNRLPAVSDADRRRVGEMPPGCDCAKVVLGKISPPECRLYGAACKPASPVGPCMVSDEGSCRIWWASGIHERVPFGKAAAAGTVPALA
jgi:hydrogenase expression/formation protein HypD